VCWIAVRQIGHDGLLICVSRLAHASHSVEWRVTECEGTAMVVKRKTRNDGNTHRNPTVYTLCSSVPRRSHWDP
jgi:predicted lipase